ncbi:hypothetical protein P175DRAFT_0228079 [Aspergillus ochraceoroseus IBT 24754]|uniref:Expansin-like EG45 domain-containing protein n=1 Tax=Aspergillus ochraceoroseus IBT 24754 TaxID=1392256 RepID=A0A2T5LWP1_9EURO|nr:uncharacterized protein P175DRAFT_0228079 [Aspergillus ochraceoroseus IBT 24754]PTU20708.1 hypothetical protein P175DRAFT_0228079 [Aspergillus ochraceoroseus IBT 24754]
MKFSTAFTTVLPLFLGSALAAPLEQRAETASLSYDERYDVASTSLDGVACSNGSNGVENWGYHTFGDLPGFPRVGGAPTITGWNSPQCGTCYQLTYQAGTVNNSIYVTAIDTGYSGFNIGLTAMNQLTNNQAAQLGRVDITYQAVDRTLCGFPASG